LFLRFKRLSMRISNIFTHGHTLEKRYVHVQSTEKWQFCPGLGSISPLIESASIWAHFLMRRAWTLDAVTVKISSQKDLSVLRYKCHKKKHLKCSFSRWCSQKKLEYLKNGTIFFETACVEIHQTLVPVTYIKTSQIGRHRLSSFCVSRSWRTWNGSYTERDQNKILKPCSSWWVLQT